MADRIIAEIQGIDDFVKKVRRVGDLRTQRRILRATIRSGTNPLKTALRREIKAKAVRTGLMAKSVVSKFKVYQSGVAWAAIGVRDRKVGRYNPGKYFHLVDLGTAPHTITIDEPYWFRLNGQWVRASGSYRHPGAKRKPMREPAIRAGRPRVQAQMAKTFEKQITREMAKRK